MSSVNGEKINFPLQASVDGSLRTSPEQECILFQPEVGVDGNNEDTSQQAAAREEFAIPTKKRQQQWMTAWSTEQSKQFDRVRSTVKSLLFWREECLVACTVCSFFLSLSVLLVVLFLSRPQLSEAGTKGDGGDWVLPGA